MPDKTEPEAPADKLPAGVQRLPDGTHDIQLEYPLRDDKGDRSSLLLRRIRIGDLEAMHALGDEAGDVESGIVLVARLTGLEAEQVRCLDVEDWARIQEVTGALMGKLTGGKTTSSTLPPPSDGD